MTSNHNFRRWNYFLLLWIMLTIQSVAASSSRFSGYLKSFSMAFSPPPYLADNARITFPDMGAVNNRIRLMFNFDLSKKLSLFSAYDISPRIQDPMLFSESPFAVGLITNGYRVTDFNNRLYPGSSGETGSFALFHNLDRFYLNIKTEKADIFIGRQAIAWGSGRVINPTDIIAPFGFNELDTEERRGVDAVRVRIPLGMMDELDVGIVFGDRFKSGNSAYFIRPKLYLWQTDLSLVVMAFRHHLLLGFDISRSIGRAGFWLEAAQVWQHLFLKNSGRPGQENNYTRVSLGIDGKMGSNTYVFFEYHFSSAGQKTPDAYTNHLSQSPFREGSVYLMGRNYLFLGFTQQISPLIPVSGVLLYNVSDSSLTLAPRMEYNIAENIYLAGGAYISLGAHPTMQHVSAAAPVFESEFGSYPQLFYLSFRIYF